MLACVLLLDPVLNAPESVETLHKAIHSRLRYIVARAKLPEEFTHGSYSISVISMITAAT